MKFLESLFGGEALTFEQLEEKAKSKGIKIANLADGEFVGKDKYEALERELKAANEKYADYDEVKAARDKAVADGEQKLSEYMLNTEIEKALAAANSADNVSVNANLDRSKIKLEDGKLTGLDEQLTQLKTDKPFLFKSDEPASGIKLNLGGSTPGASLTEDQITTSMRSAMGLPTDNK